MKWMNEDELTFVDDVLTDLDAQRLDVVRTKLVAHRETLTTPPTYRVREEPGADY